MHEHHAVIRESGQRIFQIECVDIVERNELDVFELGMDADVVFCDGQVVGRRKTLLFRSVFWISLNVHTEDFASDGRDDLVCGDRSVSAYRVAAHRERAWRSHVRIVRHGQSSFVLDSDREIGSWTIAAHVLNNGDVVAGARRPGVNEV